MPYKYTESYIEKTFLYLFVVSILLHTALLILFVFSPWEKKVAKEEPVMIDLQDLPPSKTTPEMEKKEVKRYSNERRRVAREMAPKGEREIDRFARMPQRLTPPRAGQTESKGGGMERYLMPDRGRGPIMESRPGEDLMRPRRANNATTLARVFPGAKALASLEESYRQKYSADVEKGNTKFLDTDDIQFASFLKRFKDAVYDVWNYPPEAARRGIEGVTPVRITFNRAGKIENVKVLESSGSDILDSEVRRTLDNVGVLGSLPKGYKKDKFYLIAFFQYGILRGISRSLY